MYQTENMLHTQMIRSVGKKSGMIPHVEVININFLKAHEMTGMLHGIFNE